MAPPSSSTNTIRASNKTRGPQCNLSTLHQQHWRHLQCRTPRRPVHYYHQGLHQCVSFTKWRHCTGIKIAKLHHNIHEPACTVDMVTDLVQKNYSVPEGSPMKTTSPFLMETRSTYMMAVTLGSRYQKKRC